MHHMMDPQNLERLPGLFRAWELCSVLKPGFNYRIEAAGEDRDGTALLAVYQSCPDDDRFDGQPLWWGVPL